VKIPEDLSIKDIGTALAIDAVCLAPFLGNGIRVILASDPDVDIDLLGPKDANDQLWAMGTIGSFIPVATIITIKEMIKQKRTASLKGE